MKVKVIRRFNEMPISKIREVGDEIEYPKEKAEKLLKLKYAVEVKAKKVEQDEE